MKEVINAVTIRRKCSRQIQRIFPSTKTVTESKFSQPLPPSEERIYVVLSRGSTSISILPGLRMLKLSIQVSTPSPSPKSSACVFRNIVVSLPALTRGKSKPVTLTTTVSSKHAFEPTTVKGCTSGHRIN